MAGAQSFRIVRWLSLSLLLATSQCGGRSRQDVAATGARPGGSGASSGAVGASGGRATAGSASGGSASGGSAGAANAGSGTKDAWSLPLSSERPWRSSSVPLCAPGEELLVWDVWSDTRGVYVLDSPDASSHVHFNDGSGWTDTPVDGGTFYGLTGISQGPRLFFGGSRCSVLRSDEQASTCLTSLPRLEGVFSVNPQRVFAIAGDRVLINDGADYFTIFGKLPELRESGIPYQLWADESVLVVAGDGKLFVLGDPTLAPLQVELPGSFVATALWGFASDDLWVGGGEGQLAHYDGRGWSVLQLGGDGCSSVRRLWGSDQVLYFATSKSIGRVVDDRIETIVDVGCPEGNKEETFEELDVRRIWGNSAKEVFFALNLRKFIVTLHDPALVSEVVTPDACGAHRLYWYDGAALRPF
ncbi:MAG: hypothetical protein QM756_38770 [Polyangiaceae bacterium]